MMYDAPPAIKRSKLNFSLTCATPLVATRWMIGITEDRPKAMNASVRVHRCVLPFGERTVYAVANPAAPIVTVR